METWALTWERHFTIVLSSVAALPQRGASFHLRVGTALQRGLTACMDSDSLRRSTSRRCRPELAEMPVRGGLTQSQQGLGASQSMAGPLIGSWLVLEA